VTWGVVIVQHTCACSACSHTCHPFPESFKDFPIKRFIDSVDKENQLDVTFCILYFSSNCCSTCFGQSCAHHQELTTA